MVDDRGLPIADSLVCISATALVATVLLAVTRRVRSDAPEETGEVRPTGVIGIAQPGLLQAEVYAEEDAAPQPGSDESSHS